MPLSPEKSKEYERRRQLDPAHRARKLAYMKKYYERTRDKRIARAKLDWASRTEADMVRYRVQRRKWRYGIPGEQFEALIRLQNGCCALCFEPLKLGTKAVHVDHCHDTKQVRAVLCAKCNLGLGLIGDNVEGLSAAMRYLNRYDDKPTWMATWMSPWPL